MPTANAIMRIIDANLNRLGEGLRFLEEVTRFILSDPGLTSKLKDLRHRFSPKDPILKNACLDARDATVDIGPSITVDTAEPARSLIQAIVANARRTEESLRVLEELAKTSDVKLDGAGLQSARFAVYTIEKTIIHRLMRQDKASLICGLHAIVDTTSLRERLPTDVAREMLLGGARIIQLRDKQTPRHKLLDIALEIAGLCRGFNALFIVNDALDIALATDADGLHLGQDDLPVEVARRLLPLDKIIGCSVRSVAEAKQAHTDGADYLGCGAIFATTTKQDSTALGCALLTQIKGEVDLPLIAIGGITTNNTTEVLHSGADGIAVISAIVAADSVELATRDFIKAMEVSHEPSQ